MSLNSFNALDTLEVNGQQYSYYNLNSVPGVEKLPYALKVLAENLLRTEDGSNVTAEHINALAHCCLLYTSPSPRD